MDRCVWLHLFSPVWLTSAQDRRLSPSPSACRCQDGQRSVRQRGIAAATGAWTRASPDTCGTETIHPAGKIPRLHSFSFLGACGHIKIEIFNFLFGYTDLLLFLQLFSFIVFWQMMQSYCYYYCCRCSSYLYYYYYYFIFVAQTDLQKTDHAPKVVTIISTLTNKQNKVIIRLK